MEGASMKARQQLFALLFAVIVLALPACGIENIQPDHLLVASTEAGPDKGGVVVWLSPPEDTEAAWQRETPNTSTPTAYQVFIDSDRVSDNPAEPDLLSTTVGGVPGQARYIDAGPHHFTVAALGRTPVFAGDGQVPGGGTAVLLLFGPLDALRGIFLSIPDQPSAGNAHITLVNLMRGGQTIELVSCSDATTCTPVSPALALGDLFDAELPAVSDACDPSFTAGSAFEGGCFTSRPTGGAGFGYRFFPSASLPNPPVNALTVGVWDHQLKAPETRTFVNAPVYMSDQGQSQFVFN
jgi:hypothetical protein